MTEVVLSPDDLSLVKRIASARNDPKESAGVKSKKIRNVSEEQAHIDGIAAEVAVARYFNVEPDMSSGLKGDNGYDLVIFGLKCEVKCRERFGYDFALMTANPNEFKADVGILVYRMAADTYYLYGAIRKESLLEKGEKKNYGHGERWIVSPRYFTGVDAITWWGRQSA